MQQHSYQARKQYSPSHIPHDETLNSTVLEMNTLTENTTTD